MACRIVSDLVSNQDLLTLPGTATVEEAAQRMAARKVRSVLIMDAGRLAGIFTGTDLIERVIAAGNAARTTKIADVMTADPQTVSPSRPAIEALRIMRENEFRHLPIVEGDALVGILSRRDFDPEEEREIELEERLWEEM